MGKSIRSIFSKELLLFVTGIMLTGSLAAQEKYYTRTGKISFYSKTDVENIEAHNRTVTAVVDTKSGNIQFAVLMKGFEFPKALMQEHFNENYVESDKFPKADFKGSIVNNNAVNYTANGTYNAKVKGLLTIHGQTKEIETDGKIVVKDGKISLSAGFIVLVEDYKIKVPALVRENISNRISIQVSCQLDPLKN